MKNIPIEVSTDEPRKILTIKTKTGPTIHPTQQNHPHVIPEEEEPPYNGATVDILITNRYNKRSRIKHTNHVTTFDNTHKSFPTENTNETTLHR